MSVTFACAEFTLDLDPDSRLGMEMAGLMDALTRVAPHAAVPV